MPSYEYTCLACDETITVMVKVDERDNQFCEQCGNKLVRSWTVGNLAVWSPTRNGGYS